MNWINFVSLRYFFSKKKDKFVNLATKIAICAASFSIAMLIVSFSVIRGFEETIMSKVLEDQGHIIIYGNGPYNSQEVSSKLPKELQYIPIVETNAMLIKGNKMETALLRGVDKKMLTKFKSVVANKPALAASDLPKVIVGNKFAKFLDLNIGDTITLIVPIKSAPPFDIMPETIDFQISDIVKFNLHDLNRYGVFLDIESAQKALNLGEKIHKLICFADSPKNALKFISTLENKLPNHYVYSWKNLNMLFADLMRIQRNMVSVILFAIVFLSTIISTITLVLFVYIKRREISILKILGATKKNILGIFMRIGLIVCGISSFFGLILGFVFIFNLDLILKAIELLFNKSLFDPDIYLLPAIPTSTNISDIALILGINFIVSFLATWFAASKTSGINTLENTN